MFMMPPPFYSCTQQTRVTQQDSDVVTHSGLKSLRSQVVFGKRKLGENCGKGETTQCFFAKDALTDALISA